MSTDTDTCGCCAGVEQITPATLLNRPGLSALLYRAGIHATFLETMLANLSTMGITIDALDAMLTDSVVQAMVIYPLRGLTTRSTDDPAIALLDAWAIVADVLTFYQERIANEGYLRTATERRSILELARLVGYSLRPGVASSVYLSYTLNDTQITTPIPAGSRSQSIPGPGQLPQSFETSEDFEARAAWNAIQPKMGVTQYITQLDIPNPIMESVYTSTTDGALYLKGTATNLKAHDPVLFLFGVKERQQVFGYAQAVEPYSAEQYTRVTFPPAFTPFTFYNKLNTILSYYQNIELFGVSSTDDIVIGIVRYLRMLLDEVARNAPSGFDDFTDGPASEFESTLHAFCFLYKSSIQSTQTKTSGDTLPPQEAWNGLRNFNLGLDTAQGVIRLEATRPDPGELATTIDMLFKNAQSPRTRLATWIGGMINDLKATWLPLDASFASVCCPLATTSMASLFGQLVKPASLPPVNRAHLQRNANQIFARKGDIAPQLIAALHSDARQNIYTALANANVTGDPDPSIAHPSLASLYALRVKAAPFGSSVPKQIVTMKETISNAEIAELPAGEIPHIVAEETESTDDAKNEQKKTPGSKDVTTIHYYEWSLATLDSHKSSYLYLDTRYEQIVPHSWIVITYTSPTSEKLEDITIDPLQVRYVQQVETLSRTDYGVSVKVTKLTLDAPWFTLQVDATKAKLTAFRGVTVYAQSEKLVIADEPILDDVRGAAVELDGLYDGLQSGRWVVVSGERTDIPNTSGIRTSELVMLASIEQKVRAVELPQKPGTPQVDNQGNSPSDSGEAKVVSAQPVDSTPLIPLPGDKTHTFLHFAKPLEYTYKRSTVTVAANVVHATQGETRVEVLGSGNGSQHTQSFPLRQFPLTYISASSISGADSTLEVRINDILWHETDNLAAQGPKDRVYMTRTDDQDKTTVIMGNGVQGARPPTGIENIKATYRIGIGTSGNVDAGQISQLASRPLGVKGVVNPKAATGGADKERRDQARRNAPLGVMALDRLVSVQDYEDFARTYAGIGKASASELSDGRRRLVHLTVAGSDNIPIDPTSDLFRNLFRSLRNYGNPSEPLQLALCEVKLLVVSARVLVLPDYKLELVSPNIRTALYNAFGFEQRNLGQPVFQSEVLSVIQRVTGVSYVDLDIMDAVDQAKLLAALDQIHLEELQEAADGKQPHLTQNLRHLLQLQTQHYVTAELARRTTKRAGGTIGATILPAQLVFLSPDVPDTLIVTELTSTQTAFAHSKRHAHGGHR